MPEVTRSDFAGAALALIKRGDRHLLPDLDRHAQKLLGVRILDSTPNTGKLKQLIQQEPDDEPRTPSKRAATTAAARPTTQLDQDAGATSNVQAAELGRVPLDPGFDHAAYKFDPVAHERRYQRAAAVSRQYAGDKGRESFVQDDALFRAGSRDLVAQLERDAQAVHARRQANANALPAERERLFNLALKGRGVPLADPAPVGTRTITTALDGDPVAGSDRPEHPLRFAELLDIKSMERAGQIWRERKSASFSLDDAAAEVQGFGAAASVSRPPAFPSERSELHQAVQQYQLDHGGDYLTALSAVAGATITGI